MIVYMSDICLFCVTVAPTGSMNLTCMLPLPQADTADGSKPELKETMFGCNLPCYQIVNGTVVIFHHRTHVMCILFFFSYTLIQCPFVVIIVI